MSFCRVEEAARMGFLRRSRTLQGRVRQVHAGASARLWARARLWQNHGTASLRRASPLTRRARRRPHHDCRGGEMADAEDSKSSVRKHMRVQVPPSAPKFSPTVLRFLAQETLAVKSPARVSRLTLAELWLFVT